MDLKYALQFYPLTFELESILFQMVWHFKQAASQLDKILFHWFYNLRIYRMWNEEKRGNSRWQHTNKTVFSIPELFDLRFIILRRNEINIKLF